MITRKPLNHELSDAELDLQAQRWAEQANARSRQRAILDARKKEWRNAPPQAGGLKPFTDVWSDVEAQRRGAITEEQFWEQVIRSIHEGFFDDERELLYFVNEETRITSKTLKEVVGMDETDRDRYLVHAVARSSWASIETLSEWARHQQIETPIAWQAVLVNNPAPLPTIDPAILNSSPIGKAERTKQANIVDLHDRFAMYRAEGVEDLRVEEALFRDVAVMAAAARAQPSAAWTSAPSDAADRIRAALDTDPSRSDRDIARSLRCSPTTVGKARAAMGLRSSTRAVSRGGRRFEMRVTATKAS